MSKGRDEGCGCVQSLGGPWPCLEGCLGASQRRGTLEALPLARRELGASGGKPNNAVSGMVRPRDSCCSKAGLLRSAPPRTSDKQATDLGSPLKRNGCATRALDEVVCSSSARCALLEIWTGQETGAWPPRSLACTHVSCDACGTRCAACASSCTTLPMRASRCCRSAAHCPCPAAAASAPAGLAIGPRRRQCVQKQRAADVPRPEATAT